MKSDSKEFRWQKLRNNLKKFQIKYRTYGARLFSLTWKIHKEIYNSSKPTLKVEIKESFGILLSILPVGG